jgi:hypothetical protein
MANPLINVAAVAVLHLKSCAEILRLFNPLRRSTWSPFDPAVVTALLEVDSTKKIVVSPPRPWPVITDAVEREEESRRAYNEQHCFMTELQ